MRCNVVYWRGLLCRRTWVVNVDMSYGDRPMTVTLQEVREEERESSRHRTWKTTSRAVHITREVFPNGYRNHGKSWPRWVDATQAPGGDIRSCNTVVEPPILPADLIERLMEHIAPAQIVVPPTEPDPRQSAQPVEPQ